MTQNSSVKANSKRFDEDTEAMLFHGASLSQIGRLFSMDNRDIKAKISGNVEPTGMRAGAPIYAIKDVAPYLVQPPYDMDTFIQKMSLADLPMILRKEYWAGMRSQQLFMQAAGELWPTSEVVDVISELLKSIRMAVLPIREAVERETELTERQRAIITKIIDNTLEQAHATTIERFSKVPADTTDSGGTTSQDTSEL